MKIEVLYGVSFGEELENKMLGNHEQKAAFRNVQYEISRSKQKKGPLI